MTLESGPAWRPSARSPKKREKRKRLVVILSGVLLLLIFFVVQLVWNPALPRLVFVSVTSPVPNRLAPENLPDLTAQSNRLAPENLPDLTAQSNRNLITSLFESLAQANSDRMFPVSDLTAQTVLPPELPQCEGQNLLLYLDVRAVTKAEKKENAGDVSVMLSLDGQDKAVAFSEILDLLKTLRPKNAFLLLDIDTTPPGFSSGALAADVFPVIRRQIQNSKLQGIFAICACQTGQRSWEFPEPVKPSGENQADSAESQGDAAPAAKPLPIYRNTAFAHFLAEAVKNGNAATVEELFRYLKEHVGDSARNHFAVTQTVWAYPSLSGSTDKDTPLLAGFKSPQSLLSKAAETAKTAVTTAVQGDEKDKDKQADSSDKETVEESDGNGDKPKSPRTTRADRLADFEKQLSDLATADVAVTLQDTWKEARSLIAFAQYGLRFPDSPVNGLLENNISARMRLLKTEFEKSSSASGSEDSQNSDWKLIVASLPITGQGFEVKPEELPEYDRQTKKIVLPDIMRRDIDDNNNQARRRFCEWLLRELEQDLKPGGDAMTSQSLEAVQEKIAILNGTFADLDGKVDLPDAIHVLHRLLPGGDLNTVNDSAELKRFISAVVRLARSRQQVLELTVDAQRGNSLISSEMFTPARARLVEAVLPQLQAAEKWLSPQVAGVQGGKPAAECLSRADEAIQEIRTLQTEQRKRERLSFELRSQLPSLMEFLAVRMDRQGLTEEELKELSQGAEAALKSGIDNIVVRDSQWGSGFSSQLMKAINGVNRDYRATELNLTPDSIQLDRIGQSIREIVASNAPEDRFRAWRLPAEYRNSMDVLTGDSAVREPDSIPDDKRRFAGVWTGYWSVRTLRTLNSLSFRTDIDAANTQLLFLQWQQLVSALLEERSQSSGTKNQSEPRPDGRSTTAGSAVARARLAATLKDAWNSYEERQPAVRNSRVEIVDSRDVLEMLRMPVNVKELTEAPILTSPREAQLTLSKPEGASRLYLKRVMDDAAILVNGQKMVPETNPVGGISDWYFSDLTDTDSSVRLAMTAPGKINETLPLLAVFVSQAGNPLAVHRSTVSPSTTTDWEIEMAYANPDASDFTVNREDLGPNALVKLRRFDLIPSTIGDEGKHAPVALKVSIRRTTGVASKAKVRMYELTSEQLDPSDVSRIALSVPQSEWNVEFTNQVTEVVLPFNPLPAASSPGAAAVPPPGPAKDLQVNFGMLFHIQSDGVTPPSEKWIKLFPQLMYPREYTDATAAFDRIRSILTVQLEVKKAWRQTAFKGRKIPYLLTFSDALNRCEPEGALQGVLTPESSAATIEIRFGDLEGLADLLKMESRIQMPEFGLSLTDSSNAGVPQAFRWRMEGGIPRRLDQIADAQIPEVRVEFTPVVPKETTRSADSSTGEMILGSNWENAQLAAAFHFHGGDIATGTQQWQLKVLLGKKQAGSSQTRIQTFSIHAPYDTSIRAAASEQGDWNFSTTSDLYRIKNVNPAEFGFRPDKESSCGQYELSATLENRSNNQAADTQTIRFIVDNTPPVIENLDDPQLGTPDVVPYGQETLNVKFSAADEHSGIKQIKVWLGDAKSSDIKPVDLVSDSKKNGVFSHNIPSADFPKVEAKVGEKNSVTETLHIEVMNFAELVQTESKKIRFTRPAAPKPQEKMEAAAEFGHIKVTMPMKYSSPWVVTVTGPTGPPVEQEGAKKEFEFRGLPVGKYKVEWKIKTDGSRSGSGSATVKKDQTASVAAE